MKWKYITHRITQVWTIKKGLKNSKLTKTSICDYHYSQFGFHVKLLIFSIYYKTLIFSSKFEKGLHFFFHITDGLHVGLTAVTT